MANITLQDQIRLEIKSRFSPVEFSLWLSDLFIQDIEENVIYFCSPSIFKKEKIEKDYLSTLYQIAKFYLPDLIKAIIVNISNNQVNSKEKSSKQSNDYQIDMQSPPPVSLSLEALNENNFLK